MTGRSWWQEAILRERKRLEVEYRDFLKMVKERHGSREAREARECRMLGMSPQELADYRVKMKRAIRRAGVSVMTEDTTAIIRKVWRNLKRGTK